MKGNTTALGSLENFLSRCGGVKIKANGDYKTLCPVHDDHRPSLEVGWYENGDKSTVRFVCRSQEVRIYGDDEITELLKEIGGEK